MLLKEIHIKKWTSFTHNEVVYDLSHLSEFKHEFIQAAKGTKPWRKYKFIIEFGLHTFTKGPNENKGEVLADFDSSLYYADSRETRIFCFERYELSKLLPNIASQIHESKCFHTGKGNFFVVEHIDVNNVSTEYEIYFQINRSSNKGYMRLFINSAFIRDEDHDSSQPHKKKINFFVITANRQLNKKIKIPK